MKKLIIILPALLIGLSPFGQLSAQQILGAEIYKETGNAQNISVRARVFRLGPPKSKIIFDWGDGFLDTLPLATTDLHVSGFRQDM